MGGRLIRTLSGHLEGVTCVALNDVETRVISGSEDKVRLLLIQPASG